MYRIAEYTTFQGDQGIDALAAKRLLVEHIIPLEGPATSAGGVHLGPLYYYLLALPMSVVWLEPLTDAVLMALLGALSAGLTYAIADRWFGRTAGLSAATLMAISPAAIVASRSAWNPAPAPFFVLLALYGLARNGRWLVLTNVALACVIQFHYFSLGLILVLLAAELWVINRGPRSRVLWFVLGLALAATILLPLIIHEVRDGYPNLQAALSLSSSASAPGDSLPRRLYAVLVPSLVAPFLTADLELPAIPLTLILVAGVIVATVNPRYRFGALVLAAAVLAMLAQAAVYRGPIFPHYLIAYSPVLFLAVGALEALLPQWSLIGMALLAALGLSHLPFAEPERQLARSEDVAGYIARASGAQPFAIWLLAPDDSDGAYRFQLERAGHPPVSLDQPPPARMFVICQSGPCTDAQVRDAIGPGWSRIGGRVSLDGVDVVDVAS